MYRCLNCNAVFDNPLTIKTETGPVSGCPHCGLDDMEPVEQCPDCERYFDHKALRFGGICEACLRQRIDYPTGLAYLLNRECLRDFMETIDGDDAECAPLRALILAFLTKQNEDMTREVSPFQERLRDFILDDLFDFSEWLKEEERL